MIRVFPFIFILLWSSAFITTKPLTDNSDPFSALAFRFFLVSIGFAIYSIFTNQKLLVDKKNFLESFLSGILFHGLYLGGVFYSVSKGMPTDKKSSIPEGSHLVVDKNAKLPNPKLGHVSSSCWSVENNNPFSLAIVKDGKNMIGKKLFAVSPLKNTAIEVEVISSHYVDHEGKRVRS